jgi:hypothetical protein
MAIVAGEPLCALRRSVPESLVMTIKASPVGGGDRLTVVLAKLDKPSDSDTAAADCVVAARSVASLATETLNFILRFELEKPAHFGFGEFARDIGVTRIAICAADISGPGKIADVPSLCA